MAYPWNKPSQRKGSKCTSFPSALASQMWDEYHARISQGWLSDSCFRALGFGVVCTRMGSIWANLIMALAGKWNALFTGSCLLIYLRLEIIEIHLPVFVIYLTFEILEIHLPVFVIYLRLLDILESWNTWDSSTCVCDLPETSWYTWDLNYLRFSYLCLWFTWDFLIYLTLEILEIHLPVFVIYLRLLDILETWITWDSVTCVWVIYLRLLDILEIWMIWDSSFYLWFTSIHTYSYVFEKPVIDMRMHRLKVIKWYLLWIDEHFCFSKKKVFLGYLSEFCAAPAN